MSYEIDEFKSDTPRVWIGFVTFSADEDCDDEDINQVAGGGTSVLVWTDNADDYCEQVEQFCGEMRWMVTGISSVRTFDATVWEGHEDETKMRELALEVEESHELQFSTLNLFENEDSDLEVLEQAITDIGYWNWWAEYLPDCVQVEFAGVQLWSEEPQEGQPQRGTLALRFVQPISFSFLTRNKAIDDLPHNWPDLMQDDNLEDLPNIRYEGELHFNERDFVQRVLDAANRIDVRFGVHPKSEEFFDAPVILAFWAVDIGCAVASQELTIVNPSGEIALENIPELHRKWWEYWSEYWEVRGTDKAFPEDYACETTIPTELHEDNEDEVRS